MSSQDRIRTYNPLYTRGELPSYSSPDYNVTFIPIGVTNLRVVRTGIEPARGSYVYLNYIAAYPLRLTIQCVYQFRHLTKL